jgi:anti-sigma28 factor (negative regulator of flagellin synthesis)
VQWWEGRTSRLRVLSTHHEEQLQGAYAELRELGELAEREADAPPVQVLHERIRDGEYAMNQADLALALAEQQLDGLREDAR